MSYLSKFDNFLGSNWFALSTLIVKEMLLRHGVRLSIGQLHNGFRSCSSGNTARCRLDSPLINSDLLLPNLVERSMSNDPYKSISLRALLLRSSIVRVGFLLISFVESTKIITSRSLVKYFVSSIKPRIRRLVMHGCWKWCHEHSYPVIDRRWGRCDPSTVHLHQL